MKAGRKTKWTKESVAKLEQAFSIGADVTEACLHAEISRNTYYRQVADNEQLSDRFEQLRHRPALRARNTLFEALQHDQWLAWKYLQKAYPREFGKQNSQVNSSSLTIQIVKYSP